jgi:glutathione reductase (NADPH)
MRGGELDLFVIGAGSGGVRAARVAAGYGAKVTIAEAYRVGGTCVIRGCVPKKLYVYASRFADDFADASGFGWTLPSAPTFDWPSLVAAKEREITRLSGLYEANLEKAGVEIVRERAVVTGPNEVMLSPSGRRVAARRILIATGGLPQTGPLFPGEELTVSSDEVFDLPRLPRAMLIVGGGYVAVEFASLFARLGTRVTLVMRADKPLRGFDEDLRDGAAAALARAGVALRFGCMPARLERSGEALLATLSDGTSLDVDAALLATGRVPATRGLGLENVGVATDRNGAIVVSGVSQTNVASIHAVGDVTNRVNLTPVAIREGHAFADIVFGGKNVEVDHDKIPTAVFTTPEIGTVGISEEAAVAAYGDVDVYKTSFRPMRATLSGREDRVMMKIVVAAADDRVLGVHILGEGAGEMVQLLGIAVKMGATKADFDATMAVHPTAAEELVTMRAPVARHRRGV